jgi:hypothetical protein
MTHRNEIPATHRPHRSEFDRRAINVTGHLLLGVVSLERRLASVPKQLSALVEVAGQRGSSGRLPVPVVARATGDEA